MNPDTNFSEMKYIEISSRLLARNTLLNFIGQAAPLLVGVVTIPFIVRGLGTERFGLLSLAWVILGYFTIFDLGLGRATTKYVAEALGKGDEEQIPRLVWTSVTVQAILGVVGALILVAITPLLVERLLNIPPGLIGEAKATFYLLALAIPVVLVSGSFSGMLEAKQRFDLVNAVRIPSSISTYLLTLVGLLLGFELPGIVALILGVRFGALSALVALALRVFPKVGKFSASFALFPRLFAYGGWVTISNVVIPIFVYLDRFLIGSILTLSAVAYYTAPYDVITRLLILPASIASVLFPAFSTLASSGDRDKLNVSVMRSTKYLLTAMIPPAVVFLIYAEDILRIWLGNDFAIESASVFRLLSVAVLLNAIGYIPFALIQGIGRPDVVAKYHLIELPIYAGVAFFLITQLGITGAALAWCLRMVWTIPIFFVICTKIAGVRLKALSENRTSRSLAVAAGLLVTSIAFALWNNWGSAMTILLAGTLLVGYALLVWYITFDPVDKNLARKLISHTHRFLFERGDR
jgi:O-antigen/teichoic acid export membrane protein